MFWSIPCNLNSFSYILENVELYKAFHMKYFIKLYMFQIKFSLEKKKKS